MTDTPPIPVIQADRNAAKSLLGRDDAGPSWWSIDSGNADSDQLVQAFARHRIAAIEPLVEALSHAEATLRYLAENEPDCLGWAPPSPSTVPCILIEADRARAALAKIGGQP